RRSAALRQAAAPARQPLVPRFPGLPPDPCGPRDATIAEILVSILVLLLLPSEWSAMQEARRDELAVFLRARRAGLGPADVGLPDDSSSGRRRTPGLRREEVAQLSGVGVTWYTWLEQGRDISASGQVVDALARALLLTPDQHRHLRELAGLPPPEPPAPTGELMPRLQRLVHAAAPSPAS